MVYIKRKGDKIGMCMKHGLRECNFGIGMRNLDIIIR